MDLTRQQLKTGKLIHWLAALDVIHNRLGIVIAGGIGSAPLDHETCHLKAFRNFSILAYTAKDQWY